MPIARFGPAGKPIGFSGDIAEIPRYLNGEGLDAFEYQAVRWGGKPQIARSKAESLKKEAERYRVKLTMHASYFINLSGREDVVRSSIERLKAALTAASWMAACIVVFHPGYYGDKSRRDAIDTCHKALKEIAEWMEVEGLSNLYLGLETTGKRSQLGSIDEVLELSTTTSYARPVVDWAHIYARDLGSMKDKNDIFVILEKVERALGSNYVRNEMHYHYSRIEYGRGGEREHHNLDERSYGPDFDQIAEALIEVGINPTIICETPLLDIDAVKMKTIWRNLGGETLI
ncbi:MAG: TIM barrel protein [Candidatus Bathyarchaeota archaeon]|nr:TIM barrel protein [Candidatus Bathyarchaeota archaeon]